MTVSGYSSGINNVNILGNTFDIGTTTNVQAVGAYNDLAASTIAASNINIVGNIITSDTNTGGSIQEPLLLGMEGGVALHWNVSNNQISNSNGDGIQLIAPVDSTVSGNTIFNFDRANNSALNAAGIYIGGTGSTTAMNDEIYSNHINSNYNANARGIYIDNSYIATSTLNVYDNQINASTSIQYFAQTPTYATSTYAGSINLLTGCFSVNGTCLISGNNYWTSLGGNIYNNTGTNVGIGTSTPQSLLSISGSNSGTITNALTLDNSAGGNGWGSKISFGQAGTQEGLIQEYFPNSTQGYSLLFGTGNTQSAMLVNTSGFLGIGTTSPGTLLSLNNIANFAAATSTFYSPAVAFTGINGITVGTTTQLTAPINGIPALELDSEASGAPPETSLRIVAPSSNPIEGDMVELTSLLKNWTDWDTEQYSNEALTNITDGISGGGVFNPFVIRFCNLNGGGICANNSIYAFMALPNGSVSIGDQATSSVDQNALLQVSSSTATRIFEANSSPGSHVFDVTQGGASTTNLTLSGTAWTQGVLPTSGYTYDLGTTGTPYNNGWFGYSVNIQNSGVNTQLLAGANGSNQILTLPTGTGVLASLANTNNWPQVQTFTSGLISQASSTIGGGTGSSGLTISGNATTTGNLIFSGTSSFIEQGSNILFGGNGFNTLIRPNASGDQIQIQSFGGSTNSVFTDGGALGIGTTTPSANLVVNGTTGQNLFQIATSTNQGIFTVNQNGARRCFKWVERPVLRLR